MNDHALRIQQLLQQFKLPTTASELVPRIKAGGFEEALPLLVEIFELEEEARSTRRVERLRRASRLPPAKVFETFDMTRLPVELRGRINDLAQGQWLDQAVNGLAFGLPGTGKTHVAAAIGHRLVEQGASVLFVPTFRLVQDLLAAKKAYELPKTLKKLDHFDLLILDDIGYVQQTEEEVEVLFTLLAERYERRSMLITSNLVFSAWDRIFKNPMTTAAAIDRLVHHSVILEFDVESFRTVDQRKAGNEASRPRAKRGGGRNPKSKT